MDSALHEITEHEWKPVTSHPGGSLFAQEGIREGFIATTQASSLPSPEVDIFQAPMLSKIKENEAMVYFKVPAGYKIYARASKGTWKLADSPAELI